MDRKRFEMSTRELEKQQTLSGDASTRGDVGALTAGTLCPKIQFLVVQIIQLLAIATREGSTRVQCLAAAMHK